MESGGLLEVCGKPLDGDQNEQSKKMNSDKTETDHNVEENVKTEITCN